MHISGTTRLLGLIGTPVGHSKSPQMYNYCFQKFNQDFAYFAFDVTEENTEKAINSLKLLNFRGANVTMPLKNAVIPFLDKLSPAAKAIGAVNTIVNDDGVLTGHITDGAGYTLNLKAGSVSVKDKKITLVGAGGVASAIMIQCALEGVREIAVFNLKDAFWPRAEANLEAIRQAVPSVKITLNDLADTELLKKEIAESDILSNATRLGMAPPEDKSIIDGLDVLRPDLIVTDVVYMPAETKLLKQAKEAGCRTFEGLGMLLYQGAEAYRLYTGETMPVDEIKELLYK